MIVVRLQGGMGNQMFQYATARAVALRNNAPLKLDLSFLKEGKLESNVDYRGYGLDAFNIEKNIIDDQLLKNFLKRCEWNSKWKISAVNRILFGYRLPFKKIYTERGRQFNPEILEISRNTYLVGYWQSPSYFESNADQIRKDFSFSVSLDKKNQKLLDTIVAENTSVAVHIRRGDFKNIDKLGVTSINYYEKALQHFTKRLENPSFYIFSDDMIWAKTAFQSMSSNSDLNFLDINSAPSDHVNDLRLISHCSHQIIGNSTFAWWGAWLNANPDKIVIAPQKLFNDVELNCQIQDMIPDEWERM